MAARLKLCDQPFRRGYVAAENLVIVVDRTDDQPGCWVGPHVELLGNDRVRVANDLQDVVSTVPQSFPRSFPKIWASVSCSGPMGYEDLGENFPNGSEPTVELKIRRHCCAGGRRQHQVDPTFFGKTSKTRKILLLRKYATRCKPLEGPRPREIDPLSHNRLITMAAIDLHSTVCVRKPLHNLLLAPA